MQLIYPWFTISCPYCLSPVFLWFLPFGKSAARIALIFALLTKLPLLLTSRLVHTFDYFTTSSFRWVPEWSALSIELLTFEHLENFTTPRLLFIVYSIRSTLLALTVCHKERFLFCLFLYSVASFSYAFWYWFCL